MSAQRTVERRAVEAAIWGMPYFFILGEIVRKTHASLALKASLNRFLHTEVRSDLCQIALHTA